MFANRAVLLVVALALVSTVSAPATSGATTGAAPAHPRPAALAAAKLAQARSMLAGDPVDDAALTALLNGAHRLSPVLGRAIAHEWRRWALQSLGVVPGDSTRAAIKRARVLDPALVRDDSLQLAEHILGGVQQPQPPGAYPEDALVPLGSPFLGEAVTRMSPEDFPRVLRGSSPIDPRGIRGSHAMTVVHADIDRHGRLGVIHEVLGAEALKDAAAEAVRGWTFQPMRLLGHPVEVLAEIPVEFVGTAPAKPTMEDSPIAAKPSAADPKFGEYVYVEELPEAVTRVAPAYPDRARIAGLEGTVQVQALVGTDGRVHDVRVIKSIPGLDDAAMAAVRQWAFKPALAKSQPVAVWVAVPVKFSLH